MSSWGKSDGIFSTFCWGTMSMPAVWGKTCVFGVTSHFDTLPWPGDVRSNINILVPTCTPTHKNTANAHQLLPAPLSLPALSPPTSTPRGPSHMSDLCSRANMTSFSSPMSCLQRGLLWQRASFLCTRGSTQCVGDDRWRRRDSGGHRVRKGQWLSDTVPRLNPLIWSKLLDLEIGGMS